MKNNLALVQKAKSGDTGAFASLYGEIYEDLYRFALYTLKNPVDAQDAVSDTVMDAFATIGKLRVNEAFKNSGKKKRSKAGFFGFYPINAEKN